MSFMKLYFERPFIGLKQFVVVYEINNLVDKSKENISVCLCNKQFS